MEGPMQLLHSLVLPRLDSTFLAAFITRLAELSYKYGSASSSWAAQSVATQAVFLSQNGNCFFFFFFHFSLCHHIIQASWRASEGSTGYLSTTTLICT